MLSFITLVKNIKYLMSTDLKEENRNQAYENILRVEDYCDYELETDREIKTLNVLDYDSTINTLLENPKSFCRYGDGEINIIRGKSIAFQDYDNRLAEILENILKDNISNMYVGINYNYFHSTRDMSDYNRRFYLLDVKEHRKFLLENCNNKRTYIAAAFNQLYMIYNNYDFADYYKKILQLFKDKDIVLFCGHNILDNMKYDVFKEAKSKEIIYGPSTNAFSEYDQILKKARMYSKEKVLCFILGPTSKALVYELSKEGYIAWDIGHMAKDYDAYMNAISKTDEQIKKFYTPD